ncbi:MAG: DNA-formamidopyrimidine glycosylase family protein, partial [Chloroflexota bacterium]|nr:DNA-formamidopyrimidine glycosylase family protein [Chloroflexota bacterium]
MPELPEITNLARQMKVELVGKTIAAIEVLQPKSLNVSEDDFVVALTGAEIRDVRARGKWIFVQTTQGWLLLFLGMGGEILLVTRDTLPEKRRLVLDFTDGTSLAVNFWWFGYAHWTDDLAEHKMTARLGPGALDLRADDLHRMFGGRRGRLKSFLVDQSKVAGIGNVYIQDILFRAGLHPLRAINTLSEAEVNALARAIRESLQTAVDLGGSAW